MKIAATDPHYAGDARSRSDALYYYYYYYYIGSRINAKSGSSRGNGGAKINFNGAAASLTWRSFVRPHNGDRIALVNSHGSRHDGHGYSSRDFHLITRHE